MTKERCKDCYYKGINKCFMYEKNCEEIKNCTEYLMDPYYYNNMDEETKNLIAIELTEEN